MENKADNKRNCKYTPRTLIMKIEARRKFEMFRAKIRERKNSINKFIIASRCNVASRIRVNDGK